IRMTDAIGTTEYEYDPATDRLLHLVDPHERALTFTYDQAGRRETSTDELGYQLTYRYGDSGRLTSITDSSGVVQVQYEYDTQGFLQRKVLGNGVFTTYRYDAAGQLVELINRA